MSQKSMATDMGEFLRSSSTEKSGRKPRTSVQRIAAAEGIGVPLVWRIIHEQSLYSYTSSRCVVNTQFVANILFTEEAGFTFIIPMSGWMTIPIPLWHQDININFPSMSG
jgi:hypothetical protein